ncbi:MAG: Rpn family recombination-promoting nuclease/putative transposase, partial [Chloroflexota bacterium]
TKLSIRQPCACTVGPLGCWICPTSTHTEVHLDTPTSDFDTPWKTALDAYLSEFMAFFFPHVWGAIDWTRPYEFLDHELQQAMRDTAIGRRLADCLVRVWRKDGHEAWVLIHIEVQSSPDPDFAERMFIYSYRVYDHYRRLAMSLAVLADERKNWRPDSFQQEIWGCFHHFGFPVAKLLDWRNRKADLEASENPFATVVLAHLAAQDTRKDLARREMVKLTLLRRLYERGYDRERVIRLFTFIDWLLALPKERELHVRNVIRAIEEERSMPYVTSVERIGREEGLAEGREEGRVSGLQEAIRRLVGARFGMIPPALEEQLRAADESTLTAIFDRAVQAASLEELLRSGC